MAYAELEKKLAKVTDKKPWITTPTEIVNMMGSKKRSWIIIAEVNALLKHYGLVMDPGFDNTHCYAHVMVKKAVNINRNGIIPNTDEDTDSSETDEQVNDPVPRVGLLKSANLREPGTEDTRLIYVNREATLKEVTTLMLLHKYSQLPILSNKMRRVEGMISWRSVGKALCLEKSPIRAIECKEEVEVVHLNTPLFDIVPKILSKEVVLVKDSEEIICGIITASDIAEQFKLQSEPFFLIQQIEKHIRMILNGCNMFDEMMALLKIEKCDDDVSGIDDLTFGQYIMILQNDDLFQKINIPMDRKTLIRNLEEIRLIRNDIMHFNVDETPYEDLLLLRGMADLLTELIR